MKNSIPKDDPKAIAVALDALSLLDPRELNARRKALYGSDPPGRLRRPRVELRDDGIRLYINLPIGPF
jgi:hypothetical protein